MIIVAGVRYRIGYDTINYMHTFQFVPTLGEQLSGVQFKGDLLWVYIMGLSKEICNDFFVVQIFQALIVNGFVFWFIRKHSPKPFLAILLYFLLQWWNLCFEAMREAIAVSFFLFGLDALLCGKGFKGYYLRVWPAIFAHTFGFVTLLFPFIKFLNFKKHLIVIYGVIIVFAFFIKDYVNDIVLIMEMVSDTALDKSKKHFDSDIFGTNNLSIYGIISQVIGNILPCMYIILLLKDRLKTNLYNLTPYLFIYICIYILKFQIPIFYRFLNYFEILVIIAFTQTLYIEKMKLKRFAVVSLMFLMVWVRIYSLASFDVGTRIRAYNRYVPYNSIFQKDLNEKSEMIFNN